MGRGGGEGEVAFVKESSALGRKGEADLKTVSITSEKIKGGDPSVT